MNKQTQDTDIYPKIVGKCPLCGSDVERNRPFGYDDCVKEDCPYDTSG